MRKSILLIEDDHNKAEQVKSFIESEFPLFSLIRQESYHSGKKEIVRNYQNYDLVLLDMTMQMYDIKEGEFGGEPLPLAGKKILKEMDLRGIPTPVIVVTMYENYVDGTKLSDLDKELKQSYPKNYKGQVYFTHDKEEWKDELLNKINTLFIND